VAAPHPRHKEADTLPVVSPEGSMPVRKSLPMLLHTATSREISLTQSGIMTYSNGIMTQNEVSSLKMTVSLIHGSTPP
jgi:hypothetical protein